jgi:uncharacterized protein YqfA (UPF0365 family)
MTQDNAPSDPRTNYCVMILIHSDDARKTLDNPETVRRIVADALDTLQENHDNVPAKIEEEIDYTLDVYRTECDKDVTTYRIGKLEAENAALRQQVERLSAPVTDAECEQFDLDCNGHFSRMGIEALLAARKEQGK